MRRSGDRRRERRVPRLFVFAVPLIALAVSAALVNLAWRSSRTTGRPAGSSATGATRVGSPASGDDGADPFVGCTNCHRDLDKRLDAGQVPSLVFRHKVHFAKGVSDCTNCHPANTHEPDRVNTPTMVQCFMCHGPSKAAMAPGACETCHPPNFPRKPASHDAPNWVLAGAPDQRAAHGAIAKVDATECTTCHEPAFCSNCHGVSAMPHPAGWKGAPHARAFFDAGAGVCQRCHPRAAATHDFCDTCHHPKGPPDTPWRQYHPTVVKADGANTCFQCHEPSTCAHCHVTGQERFDDDRSRLEASPLRTTPPTKGRSP